MKALIILLLISSAATAQNYGDSSITIKGTQRFAWWYSKSIKDGMKWSSRNAPDQLKNFIGSGNNPDSVFNVTVKADLLFKAVDALVSRQLILVYADYRSIMLNQPAVGSGYTGLIAQVQAIAAGNTSQKLAAQWVIEQYTARQSALQALYDEEKAEIIKWSKQ